jgi:arylsulfatase A-like enzyme
MITYWKGQIKPCISEELVFQLDCFASLAALTGQPVPDGLDSQDQLDAFIGEGEGRESLVVEAKSRLAYRKGDYMMVPPYKGKAYRKVKEVELGNVKDYALYNLKEDRMQQNDLSASEPDKLEEMKQEFHQLVGKYYHPDITELRKNF